MRHISNRREFARLMATLTVLSLVLYTVSSCATGYQRDVQWCQERYFGFELDQCLAAAQHRAQREEQRR